MIKTRKSLLAKAIENDKEAVELMFRQFISAEETVKSVEYLGKKGFGIFGSDSFICLTDKSVANFEYGPFKKFRYEEMPYEKIVYATISQPAKIGLYISYMLMAIGVFGSWQENLFYAIISTPIIKLSSFLNVHIPMPDWLFKYFLPLTVALFVVVIVSSFLQQAYYKIFKCGLNFINRPGAVVYAFLDRANMGKANQIYRDLFQLRDKRLIELKGYITSGD